MRCLFRLLLSVVALAIVLALVLVFFADRAAKAAIEEGGSYALGAQTELDGASIGLSSGRFALSGLVVHNPPGFSEPHFIDLKNAELDLAMTTLFKDKIEAEKLEINGLDLVLERNASGKTNYDEILKNLQKLQAPPSDKSKPAPKETPSSEPKSSKQFVIHTVVIQNIAAHVYLPGIGKTNVTVPEVRLDNVGSGQTLGELIGMITNAVLRAVAQSAGTALPSDLIEDLKGKLPNLKGVGLKLSEGVKSAIEDVGKKGGAALKEVGKGLEDLIHKK